MKRLLGTLVLLRGRAPLFILPALIAAIGLLSGPTIFDPGKPTAEAVSLDEIKKLLASDAQAGDYFGWSVAISGDTAVVGAYFEDAGSLEAGAAYIFQRDEGGAGNWGEVKKLTASDAQAFDRFGYNVAVSGDTAVIGTRFKNHCCREPMRPPRTGSAGAAYVFQRNQGGADNWGEVKKLTASDAQMSDVFGYSLAVSGDTAVVGAPLEDLVGGHAGAAYVFQRDQGGADNWGEVKKLTASDAQAGDQFGLSVAVSGDNAVVGANWEDSGGDRAGAAYIFHRNQSGADNWGEVKKLTASGAQAGDYFGNSVALSGDTAVVGANGEDAAAVDAGAAYVFRRNQGGADNWGEVKKLLASDAQAGDYFGNSVALSGDTAVVGAYFEDAGGANAGAAYVFGRDHGGADNWGEVKKLTAPDAQAYGYFGVSVSVSGGTAFVGVDDGMGAGATYVFQGVSVPPPPTPTPTACAGPCPTPTLMPTSTPTPTLLSLSVDCDVTTAGIQSNCNASPGAYQLGVYVTNTSGAPAQLTAWGFKINVNQLVLAPNVVACSTPALDCNPDVDEALTGSWDCNGPDPAPDQSPDLNVAISYIGCFDFGAGFAMADGQSYRLATINYVASNGSTMSAIIDGSVYGGAFNELMTCNPIIAVEGNCFAANVSVAEPALPPCSDLDCDGVLNAADNCSSIANSDQLNSDRNYFDNSPPYADTIDDKTWANSDAAGDACDTDDDNDGRSDADEATGSGCAGAVTNPILRDTDGDRFLDGAECALSTDPTSSASKPAATLIACGPTGDTDGDKISDRIEFCYYGTNPNSTDTDGDKALDGARDGCEAASFNVDRIVNVADMGMLATAVSNPTLRIVNLDVNKDGVWNSGDQGIVASFISPAGQCPG